jgi:hypothetical protein
MWAGVVPQQPPTIQALDDKRRISSANSLVLSGYRKAVPILVG